MFETSTTKELRDGLAAWCAEQATPSKPLPQPAGARPGLTPEQQETLFENWVADIQRRRPDSWTNEEKAVLRAAINRALKTL
jgi:hypothetical protein